MTTMSTTGTFTRMDESTAEQWAEIGRQTSANQTRVAERVLELLRSLEEITDGFATDQLTHSLQTATRAQRDGADDEIVVAALCHDIGKAISVPNHPAIAAEMLRPYVRQEVYDMVRTHQDFQGRHYYQHFGGDPDARDTHAGYRLLRPHGPLRRRLGPGRIRPGVRHAAARALRAARAGSVRLAQDAVTSAAGTAVVGEIAPGWEPVREALAANGSPGDGDPGDLGAAVCVLVRGRPVADLWHGWADLAGTRPWAADTLVNAYSVVKPVAAGLALLDVRDGLVDLDEPLARVWPELTGEGRELISLRHVLAHRAGLPAVREPLPEDAVYSWDTMTSALARTRPWWPPGSAHGYHVNTFGFLAGEPVHRLHATGFGAALHDRLTGPLGLDLLVGVSGATRWHAWPTWTSRARSTPGSSRGSPPILIPRCCATRT